jgi:ABC-2 type transport system ATP-binding protein
VGSAEIVTVSDLRKVYASREGEVRAVDGVSFEVRKGEVFSFLGPNGAGKTTTVEILECIRRKTSGSATVGGLDVDREPERVKRMIGALPQDFSALGNLTARENVEYFSRMYDRRADVDSLLEMVGLGDKSSRMFKFLSGGEKRRVGVAIALVNDPELVFLDEPTTGIDPRGRRQLWETIRGLRKQSKTVFLTTHYIEEAEYLSDRAAMISKGKIVAIGTPQDLISRHGARPQVRMGGLAPDAVERMRAAGFAVDGDGGDATVELESMKDSPRLLELLVREKVEYHSITVRPSSLEDVFLSVTGERLEEEKAEGDSEAGAGGSRRKRRRSG